MNVTVQVKESSSVGYFNCSNPEREVRVTLENGDKKMIVWYENTWSMDSYRYDDILGAAEDYATRLREVLCSG